MPAAVPLGGRVLAPRWPALAQELGSCRCVPRRQGLNALGYGARYTFLENFGSTIYFSKIMTN
jgi:hypothetical protein